MAGKSVTDFEDDSLWEIPEVKIIVPFGKYKGQTIKEIIENDPGYVMWLRNETGWGKTHVSDDQYEEAERDDMELEENGDRPSVDDFFDDIPF